MFTSHLDILFYKQLINTFTFLRLQLYFFKYYWWKSFWCIPVMNDISKYMPQTFSISFWFAFIIPNSIILLKKSNLNKIKITNIPFIVHF